MKLHAVPFGVWIQTRNGFAKYGRADQRVPWKRESKKFGFNFVRAGGWCDKNIAFSSLPWARAIYLGFNGECVVRASHGEFLPFDPGEVNVCILPWASELEDGEIFSPTIWTRVEDGSWWWRMMK